MNKEGSSHCKDDDSTGTSNNSFALLVKSLIDQLHKEYTTQGDISTDLLLSMYNCFGNTLERALKHADTKPLTIFESLSGQKLWKVHSSKETSIYILPHINFCKCEAYRYQVLQQNAAFLCKHYLSAELNFARKSFNVEMISDKKMTDLLINIYMERKFAPLT